jgi:hypothetical protein
MTLPLWASHAVVSLVPTNTEARGETKMRTKMLVSMFASTVSLLASSGDLQADGCNKPPATCANAPAWHEGAKYKKGDRVLGDRGNLWECKKTSAPCGSAGHEPDVDARAADAWQLIQSCFVFDGPELAVTDVVVSSAQCNSAVTLRALVRNDNPFGGVANVAFYHSTSKTLIGVVQVDLPTSDAEPPFVQVEMVWNNPTLGSALITVVADDDGTGRSQYPEVNEADNTVSATLATCAAP